MEHCQEDLHQYQRRGGRGRQEVLVRYLCVSRQAIKGVLACPGFQVECPGLSYATGYRQSLPLLRSDQVSRMPRGVLIN